MPRHRDALRRPTPHDAHAAGLPSGLRVMAVEDDAEVRQVVETFLETLGCQVVAVATAELALARLDAAAQALHACGAGEGVGEGAGRRAMNGAGTRGGGRSGEGDTSHAHQRHEVCRKSQGPGPRLDLHQRRGSRHP
jgi:hypothetical protein